MESLQTLTITPDPAFTCTDARMLACGKARTLAVLHFLGFITGPLDFCTQHSRANQHSPKHTFPVRQTPDSRPNLDTLRSHHLCASSRASPFPVPTPAHESIFAQISWNRQVYYRSNRASSRWIGSRREARPSQQGGRKVLEKR